jgi:hypothetical protein
MDRMGYAYNIFVGKPEAKMLAGKPMHRREDYIRMNLKETGRDS